MRLAAPLFLLVLAGCAGAPTDTSTPLSRACTPSNCFNERNVRDFEVIDERTLVVYVGSQRCPFMVELDGMFCDLTFTPTLHFRSAGIPFSEVNTGRVCSFGRTYIDAGPFGREEDERCRVRDVVSMTDDELVDLYVNQGAIPPLPPVGSGELEVVRDREDADDEAQSGDADPRAPGSDGRAAVQ